MKKGNNEAFWKNLAIGLIIGIILGIILTAVYYNGKISGYVIEYQLEPVESPEGGIDFAVTMSDSSGAHGPALIQTTFPAASEINRLTNGNPGLFLALAASGDPVPFITAVFESDPGLRGALCGDTDSPGSDFGLVDDPYAGSAPDEGVLAMAQGEEQGGIS